MGERLTVAERARDGCAARRGTSDAFARWVARTPVIAAWGWSVTLQVGIGMAVALAGGTSRNPEYFAAALGFALGFVLTPRGLEAVARPSYWQIASRAPADATDLRGAEYRWALVVVSAAATFVALVAFFALTGATHAVMACLALAQGSLFVWLACGALNRRRRTRREAIRRRIAGDR